MTHQLKEKVSFSVLIATYQNYSPKKGIVSNIRVLRTNLVYAIGLWSDICSEEVYIFINRLFSMKTTLENMEK